MKYERSDLGFSFELPQSWRQDHGNLTLSFHGPNGGPGTLSEVIQLRLGTILTQYSDPSEREKYLYEPGGQLSRTTVGMETNSVVLELRRYSLMSVVRDGVHYNFSYANDRTTREAMEHLKNTARFGTPAQAAEAISNWTRNLSPARLLRIPGLHRDFRIDTRPPPILQGAALETWLRSVTGHILFLGFDRTIDGPQTATRLIRETLTLYGAIFTDVIMDAEAAIWIGGTGSGELAFVVLDPTLESKYFCYSCGPRELTAAAMTTIAQFWG
jgi:hypothetical protein